MSVIKEKHSKFLFEKQGDYQGCYICDEKKRLNYRVSGTLFAIMKNNGYTEEQIFTAIKNNAEKALKEIPNGRHITILLSTYRYVDIQEILDTFFEEKVNWYDFVLNIKNIDRDEYIAINGKIDNFKCKKCFYPEKSFDGKIICNHEDEFFNKYRENCKVILISSSYMRTLMDMSLEIEVYGNMISCPLNKDELDDLSNYML